MYIRVRGDSNHEPLRVAMANREYFCDAIGWINDMQFAVGV